MIGIIKNQQCKINLCSIKCSKFRNSNDELYGKLIFISAVLTVVLKCLKLLMKKN